MEAALGCLRVCERCNRVFEAAGIRVRRAHWDVKADYEALVAAGELNFDPYQQNSVEQLQNLQLKLSGYEPPPPQGFLGKVLYAFIMNNVLCIIGVCVCACVS